jgi:hypothetical protein
MRRTATMTRIEEIWSEEVQKVESLPISEGEFRILAIDPSAAHEFYAGIDAERRVLVALRVHREPPRIDLNSQAIKCFGHSRRDGSWLMVLRLDLSALTTVFGRLCQDLVDGAGAVSGEAALLRFMVERLRLWERLFRHLDRGYLPAHRIKGLVGELMVLESLLSEGDYGALETIRSWEGPLDADQDFKLPDRFIEVKTVGPGITEVTIASLGQLDAPAPLALTVVAVRSTDTPIRGESVTLNSLTKRVSSRIAGQTEAVTLFRDRLLCAGYVEDAHYDQFWYTEASRRVYPVDPDFPRLTSASVPSGIIAATYTLALDLIEGAVRTTGANDG